MIYSVNVTETMFNDNPFNIVYLFTDISDARDCVFYYDTHPFVDILAYDEDDNRCPEYDEYTRYWCNDIIYHHDDDEIPDSDTSGYGCVCRVNEHLFPRNSAA